jgi:hypothetical protein
MSTGSTERVVHFLLIEKHVNQCHWELKIATGKEREFVCVCVFVKERERERERVCV